MSQYLDDIKRAHRDLLNLDKTVMSMTTFFGVVLKNLGKERKGNGPYRRVYETLLEMNRLDPVEGVKVLTWKQDAPQQVGACGRRLVVLVG